MPNEEFRAPTNDISWLQKYLESRIKGLTREMELQFAANETALLKAKESTDREMEHLNELRTEFTKKSEIFATKTEVSAVVVDTRRQIDATNDKIAELITQLANDRGKVYGAMAVLTVLFSIIQLAVWYFK